MATKVDKTDASISAIGRPKGDVGATLSLRMARTPTGVRHTVYSRAEAAPSPATRAVAAQKTQIVSVSGGSRTRRLTAPCTVQVVSVAAYNVAQMVRGAVHGAPAVFGQQVSPVVSNQYGGRAIRHRSRVSRYFRDVTDNRAGRPVYTSRPMRDTKGQLSGPDGTSETPIVSTKVELYACHRVFATCQLAAIV